MDRVEQLIRESLRARANDVEPTPMLWLEVDRRVARRKRFQVMTWSLAGATAALAGVLAVPAIIDLVTDDRPEFDIGAVPETPAGGVVPEFYVTDADNRLQVRDLATGELVSPEPTESEGRWGDPVDELAVRPGSTGEDGAVAAIRGLETGDPYIEVAATGVGNGGELWLQSGGHALAEEGALRQFRPSVVWTPDQDVIAFTLPVEDQSKLVLWRPGETTGELTTSRMITRESAVVFGEGDVELLDWVGRTADTGDQSVLYYRDDLGVQTLGLTVAEDGTMTPGPQEVYDSWYDVASSHALPGDLEPPYYAIVEDDGPVLIWADTDTQVGTEIPLSEVFGDVDPADLWIDAKQDAAIVGNGTRTFLYAHDGEGNFVPAAELDTSGPAALFDAIRPGQATPEPEPTDEPTDEPTQEPDPGPEPEPTDAPEESEPAPGEGSGTGAALPDPLVTVSMDEMLLHGPDGPQQIAFLPSEGHSVFLAARVRPGSTVDDLTVVALTTAEGTYDLRTVRVVDGEAVTFEAFPEQYRPGGNDVGAGFTVTGPVWSPDGGLLAWFETWDGTTRLRTVGWDDGANGPGTGRSADDNAMFDLGAVPEWPLEPQEWVSTGDGTTELWSTVTESRYWYGLEVQVQGDGGPALPADAEVTTRRPEVPGAISGLAAEDTGVRWLLSRDGATTVLIDDPGGAREQIELPDDLWPGEGLPDLWVRDLSEGALVGSRNTGIAYYVAPDGSINQIEGQVTGGDPIL